MNTFMKFQEYNDHEGERWVFWLQREGNENQLVELESLLEPSPVAMLHQYIHLIFRQGYLNNHNKVVGRLTVPILLSDEVVQDTLYKGGIRDLFEVDE